MSLFSVLVDAKSRHAARVSDTGALSVDVLGRGEVPAYLCRHLRNAAGSDNTAIDGSAATGTPTEFFVRPPPGEIWRLARLLVFIEDSKINADDYGAIAGGLTNGIELYVADDSGVINHLMDNGAVNVSAEWAEYCYDAETKVWGAGNEFLTVRWTFTRVGIPIRLDGSKRQRLAVLIQDNLTGLVGQEFIVQGYKE